MKQVQSFYFCKELPSIASNNCSKVLLKLHPFIDQHGLVRVGGRIRNSNLPYESKHPILFPKDSHLSRLIVHYYHVNYLHSGTRTLMTLILKHFWIISARKLIRKCISESVICAKLKAKSITLQMGDLPVSRFAQGRPFMNVGLDFAGPFCRKKITRQNAKIMKCYFCIFICLSTKAVHFETVTDHSTEAFLATFDRLAARRGLCSNLFSDWGRNFIGAARQLRDLYTWFRLYETQTQISTKLAQKEIQSHFNPQSAPHFGGLWEAGVTSIKFHLVRVTKGSSLTYEELWYSFLQNRSYS